MKDKQRLLSSIQAVFGLQSEGEKVVAVQAEFDSFKAQVEADKAAAAEQLAAAVEMNQELVQQVAELKEQIRAINDVAAAEAKAAADKEAAALAKKLADRKQLIAGVVGDVEAESVFAALSTLSDESFDRIVKAMGQKVDAEANADVSGVQGVEAQVNLPSEGDDALKILHAAVAQRFGI